MAYQHRDRSKDARDVEEAHLRAKFAYFRDAEAKIYAGPVVDHTPVRVNAVAHCGTHSGWARHNREGTEPCRDCLDARAIYQREYRARKVAA